MGSALGLLLVFAGAAGLLALALTLARAIVPSGAGSI